jgi:hypothetical protein
MSKIGEMLAFARRKGNDWFVCVINGNETQSRTITLSLNFLGEGTYRAYILKDALSKRDTVILDTNGTATASMSYTVEMRVAGGWVGRFLSTSTFAGGPEIIRQEPDCFWYHTGQHLWIRWPGNTIAALGLFTLSGKLLWTQTQSPHHGNAMPVPHSKGLYCLKIYTTGKKEITRTISVH